MIHATLCFLTRNNQILLAMKKRGFGEGKWNGVGGKVDRHETSDQAMIRETKEEINIMITDYKKVGEIDFFWHTKPAWNAHVYVYLATKWEGEPEETEEMKPQWFNQKNIPFEQMWPDDEHWLPKVLTGKKIQAAFYFQEGTIIDHFTIKEVLK